MLEECPQCGNITLRITNVMGTTQQVYRACKNCCYRDKIKYDMNGYFGSPVVEKKLKWKH